MSQYSFDHNFENVVIELRALYFQILPFYGEIPDGLSDGKTIQIRGRVNRAVEDGIVIDIQNGPSPYPSEDISFHISIRFKTNTIVRNTYRNGDWETEELDGGLPIAPGQFVEISVLANYYNFVVYINGKQFCEYAHRMPLDTAKFIHTRGDWSVESISLQSPGIFGKGTTLNSYVNNYYNAIKELVSKNLFNKK